VLTTTPSKEIKARKERIGKGLNGGQLLYVKKVEEAGTFNQPNYYYS